jgi:hypothetical protein
MTRLGSKLFGVTTARMPMRVTSDPLDVLGAELYPAIFGISYLMSKIRLLWHFALRKEDMSWLILILQTVSF